VSDLTGMNIDIDKHPIEDSAPALPTPTMLREMGQRQRVADQGWILQDEVGYLSAEELDALADELETGVVLEPSDYDR